MHYNKVKFCILLFGFLFFLNQLVYAETLDIKLSRDKIAIGETVTVSFYLNNAKTEAPPDFSPLEKDFKIEGSNYGNTINVLNGVTQTQTIWQVVLEPRVAGELVIPEINFGKIKSPSRKLVVEEAASAWPSDQQNTPAFVRAEVSTTSPYVQSQVLYTFKLFYRSQLDNPRLEQPRVKDIMLAQVGEDKFYETKINDEPFYVFERNYAIFPQKIGKLIIPPVHFRAAQIDTDGNFMNDPFSAATAKLITLATPSFKLNVQKIPTAFQGKNWLPAQNVTLNEEWSSDISQWETGNPITRTITIEAQGIRADQIPDFASENIKGVNIYADPPHRSNSMRGNSILGTLRQKITYIPNLPQSFTLPAIKLTWWNIQTNKNTITQLKPVTVHIKSKLSSKQDAPLTAASPEIAKEKMLASQNVHIENALEKSVSIENTLFYRSIWFWVALALLIVWLLTLILFWKLRQVRSGNQPFSAQNILPVSNAKQFTEKDFIRSCKQGNIIQAQQYLLSWAKTEWGDAPHSLGGIRERLSDDNLKQALELLEKALYSDNAVKWEGNTLLTAFKQAKKSEHRKASTRGIKEAAGKASDPLPPLNP